MDDFMRALFMFLLITNISHQYQKQKQLSKLWKKSLFSKGSRNARRQDVAAPVQPPIPNAQNVKATQGVLTSTRRPSFTLYNSPVTRQKSPVTPILQTTPNTKLKESQHVVVPEPVDVIPVQTVPPQRFILTTAPPPFLVNQYNVDARKSNRTHYMLPNLPVYKPQDIKPLIPVKEAPEQAQIKLDMSPIEPLPIMTRPTVTVLQHVIGQNPTRATLQSVVVPNRKEAPPPPPLTPLPVIQPHSVPMPLKPLRPLAPLAPLPPQEPHIIHHISIPIPKDCQDPHPCGCDNNCSGQ